MSTLPSNNRREFIKTASLAGLATLTIPSIVSASFEEQKVKRITLKENDIILFQGDSITDAGRDYKNNKPNEQGTLGNGYPMLVAGNLLSSYANKKLAFYNKGISGNKVFQLIERWQTDCIDIKPTVLSILIGVNDFWHTLKHGYSGTIDTYKNDFIKLLTNTKAALPGVKLIIGEPFAVNGINAVTNEWHPKFDAYRAAAKEIAGQFGAVFIPYQSIFDEAQKSAPGVYWTNDGVHPNLAGSGLMAHAWLEAVKG